MGNFRFTGVAQNISSETKAAADVRLTNALSMASYLSTVREFFDLGTAGSLTGEFTDGSLPREFTQGPSALGEIAIIATGVNAGEPDLDRIRIFTDRMNDTIGEDGEYNRMDVAGSARMVEYMTFTSMGSLVSTVLKTAAIADAAGVEESRVFMNAPQTIIVASDDEDKGRLMDRFDAVNTSWDTLSSDDQRAWEHRSYTEDLWNDSTTGHATAKNLLVNLLAGGNSNKVSHISMRP